jgi:hypothetical protein
VTDKVRVYELSRETGLSNKEVIRRLQDLGVEAATHSSSITEPEARRFLDSLGRKDAEQEEEERRREEEARRLADIDIEAVGAPEQRKARKVLPPHLREQQEALSERIRKAESARDVDTAILRLYVERLNAFPGADVATDELRGLPSFGAKLSCTHRGRGN